MNYSSKGFSAGILKVAYAWVKYFQNPYNEPEKQNLTEVERRHMKRS